MTARKTTAVNAARVAQRYANDFSRRIQSELKDTGECEWACILWCKEYWTTRVGKAFLNLEQAKDRLADSAENRKIQQDLLSDANFLLTISKVYWNLFDDSERLCPVKDPSRCPFAGERTELRRRGLLARAFTTILQRAVYAATREENPIDAGLVHDVHSNVYGIDLTNFSDLIESLKDGRFENLFTSVMRPNSSR